MNYRLSLALPLAIAALLAASCSSVPTTPLRNNVAIKKAAYLSPAEGVLVYGSAAQAKSMFNALSSRSIDNLEMIQLNPSQKPMIITPARSGNVFFTEPLPLGSSVRFFYFSISLGRSTTLYERGVQGSGPTDRKLDKPGLCYLGSLLYCDKSYKDNQSALGSGWADSADLYPYGDEKEIDALKRLLPKFRGTGWEPIISARIEELKK
jgi:hypothetical protein